MIRDAAGLVAAGLATEEHSLAPVGERYAVAITPAIQALIEAPDDETAASVLLAADMLGNIRTQTMRAFTAKEMERILSKAP